MNIHNSLTELIGNTPLLRLDNFARHYNLSAGIIAKLEYMNPSGSIKDRTAYAMIQQAENRGLLKPGSVIIEPTSGNTGIGLASIASAKGYRVILTMPESMSVERRMLLKAYGAELVLTEAARGMAGAIDKAAQLAAEIPGAFMPGQFNNPANPAVHKSTTGPEIWRDTGGIVNILVCGVGTGGTISGAGEYLKSRNPDIKVVAVEPAASPVLSGGAAGSHRIQGIGAGFIPDTLNTGVYDEVIPVADEEALSCVKTLAATQGLLAGISSGGALHAATRIALRRENASRNIVVILPDSGERYLSMLNA